MLTANRRRALVTLIATFAALFIQTLGPASSFASTTYSETAGGVSHTWTNYTNAGGTQGPDVGSQQTIQIACRLTGFKVADGDTWWYQIAQSPWSYNYYVSADAFYNNGATSGSLKGTPFYDPNVPVCGSGSGTAETTGGSANTWSDYNDAGGTQGPTVGSNATVQIACKTTGFKVADGNTWWYQIASSPWNNGFYVSADAFYNNGHTSGSLKGTPFVDSSVPDCSSTSSGSSGGTGGDGTSAVSETTGGVTGTHSDYTNAGGTTGPSIGTNTTVQIACKVTGFKVSDGNTWWYEIASSPWNSAYYASADAFYNNGATSGSLTGTPFVDTAVPTCSAPSAPRPSGETAGGSNGSPTFSDYYDAGGVTGPRISSGTTVQVTCRITGFAVSDGDTWWYQVSTSPWSDVYYAPADDFYNNGATSGSLSGTPFVDTAVPQCAANQESSAAGHALGSSSASTNGHSCHVADPVNCASGDFWQAFTDINVPGPGAGLELTRTYNDQAASTLGLFGNGWASTFDATMANPADTRDGSATVTLPDGSQVIAQPSNNGFSLPDWSNSTLVSTAGGYSFTQQATTVYTFGGSGDLLHLTSISDLNGNTTTFAYTNGLLSSVTDSVGRSITVAENAQGLISSVSDPMGRTTTYSYDSNGNLTSVVDPLGRTWTYAYNTSNEMTGLTDPRGGITTNAYNSLGQVTSQTDAAGLTTTFQYANNNYSSTGGTTTITDPHGNVEVQQYVNGFMTEVTKAYGTSGAATWTYAYDPNTYGITSETDPNGNTTSNTYNSAGQLTSTQDADGDTSSTTYNSLNEPLTTTTPLDETTNRTYDSAGNLLTSTDPDGNETTYAYADSSHPGSVTSITEPDGGVVTYKYDQDDDIASATTAPGSGATDMTTASYDADGEQVCKASAVATASGVSCPSAGQAPLPDTTATTYDADGETASVTDPDGNTTAYQYDADGNQTSVTDGAGNVTQTSYDADNRVISTISAAGQTNSATRSENYDVAPGKGDCPSTSEISYCTTNTDPAGDDTVEGYDAANNLIQTILPGGATTTYTYDLAGNKISKTDNAGTVTSYGYDADNRLTSISYNDGQTPSVEYTYDADGHRASMIDGSGTSSYTYDSDGHVTSVTNGAGSEVTYSYDGDGNVTKLGYPNGKSVTRTFNMGDQMTALTDWLGNTTTFTYDPDGNVSQVAYGNGDTVANSYDRDDAVAASQVTNQSGSKLAGLAYTRNADELVSQETDTGALIASKRFSYNDKNQLTLGGPNKYRYDENGDLTSTGTAAQAFNAAGQLTTSTANGKVTTYGYDPDGDRSSVAAGNGTTTDYGFDAANRLTSVSISGQKGDVADYTYNGDGLRMSETTANNTYSYTWDGSTGTPKMLTDGTKFYIYGPQGLPIEQINANAVEAYYLSDNIGTTRALLGINGGVGATYSYTAYGYVTKKTGTLLTPLQYAGSYADPTVGLDYLINRFYDPSSGQFVSVDPDLADTYDPYGYSTDDPANLVDPLGLFSLSDAFHAAADIADIAATFAKVTVVGKAISAFSDGYDIGSALGNCLNDDHSAACEVSLRTLAVDSVATLTSAGIAKALTSAGAAKAIVETVSSAFDVAKDSYNLVVNDTTGTASAPQSAGNASASIAASHGSATSASSSAPSSAATC